LKIITLISKVFLPFLGLCAIPAMAKPMPPLEAYGDLPAVEDMAISPSGNGLAFVAKVEGARRLYIMGKGNEVRMIAPVADMKIHGVHWAGDEIVWLHASATENLPFGFTEAKHEFSRAILLYPVSRKSELVFNGRSGIANTTFGHFGTRQANGKWIAFFGGIELARSAGNSEYVFERGEPALFAVDLDKNSPRKVAPAAGENHFSDWLVDGGGTVAATLDISSSTGKWDIKNAARDTLISGVDLTGDVSLVSFGRTPATIIYSIEDPESGDTRWFEVPLAGGKPTEVLAGVDVDRIYTDRDDGTLLGYLDGGGGSPKPVFFAQEHQAILTKLYRAFSQYNLTVLDWTPNFSHFIVISRGNGDSGTYYLVDIEHSKADPVGYERPAIFGEHVGPISTVKYKAADGLELDGILTLPPERDPKNLPVVVFPHGGPAGHDIETFDWWAQAFASRGYAVFQPNFRGSTNRDDAFRRAGFGQWGLKMQTDISDGLAELVKRQIVDPKRACIMGASYGGYAALAGVTLQQDLYRCAVAVAPVSDLKLRYDNVMRETNRDKMTRRILLESMGNPSGFNTVSPRRLADRADAPILLIHGKNDTVVEFEHSTKMANALKDAGKPHELVVLREADHWLSHAETRKQMLEEAMRFVQKHNPAN
jgi:dipeptidyl aminopeptidase/acylaminoacyl peptidase